MVLAISGAVLIEADVEHPVEAILDPPVRADSRREGRGIKRGRHAAPDGWPST
jgi:hypothetical protein